MTDIDLSDIHACPDMIFSSRSWLPQFHLQCCGPNREFYVYWRRHFWGINLTNRDCLGNRIKRFQRAI